MRVHLTLLVLLPAFGVMFDWQLHRALGGNKLSWAYTVEWPVFAGYAVFMWWRLLHEGFAPRRAPRAPRATPDKEARNEADLAAYNAYLARLKEEDTAGAAGPSGPGEPPREPNPAGHDTEDATG
jgi:hypothetical protein